MRSVLGGEDVQTDVLMQYVTLLSGTRIHLKMAGVMSCESHLNVVLKQQSETKRLRHLPSIRDLSILSCLCLAATFKVAWL